jgi:hypothetical protein
LSAYYCQQPITEALFPAASHNFRNLACGAAVSHSGSVMPARPPAARTAPPGSGANEMLILALTLQSQGRRTRPPKKYSRAQFPIAAAP